MPHAIPQTHSAFYPHRYFIHRELQMETFAFTLTKHIPAKRSDVYRKFFDEPEFWSKVHPNW